MTAQFKVGDVVQLKSGHVNMIVDAVDESCRTVSCVWFTGAKRHTSNFHPDALIIAPVEPTQSASELPKSGK